MKEKRCEDSFLVDLVNPQKESWPPIIDIWRYRFSILFCLPLEMIETLDETFSLLVHLNWTTLRICLHNNVIKLMQLITDEK